jgi:hypothetical protein
MPSEIVRPALPANASVEEIRRAIKLTNDNLSRVNERLKGHVYTLTHGVELLVEKPVKYTVTKAVAGASFDPTTGGVGLPVESLTVREVTPTTLGITARYAPPPGECVAYRSAAYAGLTTGTSVLPFDATERQDGDISLNGSGELVCASDGLVAVNYSFEPSVELAGDTGEAARSYVSFASRTALTNTISKTVTSISLTAGDWDISMICCIGGSATTGTALYASISTTTNVLTADYGDNINEFGVMPTATAGTYITIPSYRVTIAATTTYYMVAQANFTVGTPAAWGRLSARRATPARTTIIDSYVRKNDSLTQIYGYSRDTVTTSHKSMTGSALVPVTAGDRLQLAVSQDTGSTQSLVVANGRNHLHASYVAPPSAAQYQVTLMLLD